ncbi:non-hydrolyzing UDP-N-acetylglucosamine 2-epimerase [Parvicella tangerina]|uniref:UDP-2,3-diacetamido-2,3-dideoxy-D-glucuronate 2-epimerase n=1 Tax=Parvicella tangerina TaxID=2829795 RepID=A0A916JLW4_9FLAO|nr:UDP-N-acetylglucosamine 2-epimerase (non-hydrolyzing) [Parvicella tangerina]CAG5080032.1 UDP-2,3-diacetamido-2,3-dideoxy-D-glucuronate 2-epimerase [Parvicella tangerina]
MKIVTIIGARPQIIKAAGLSRAIKNNFSDKIEEIIVHTGQHYDQNMSEVFFEELGIPKPNINLNVGSGKHGEQTAKMISGIEDILINEQPDAIVLYGDTNSTLAGAVAASKIHVPIVHIEAGLRSYNKQMPEEINRIMCDHASTLLFSPTKAGVENLVKEGFKLDNIAPFNSDQPGVFHCGDIMYDNSLYFSELSDKKSSVLQDNKIKAGGYVLSTIHRNDNTDQPERLSGIFEAILELIDVYGLDFVLPLHPRTEKQMKVNLSETLQKRIEEEVRLKLIPPVSFLDMIALEKNSKIVVTDSGGVQKEAFFFQKPCVILRPETEWVELVACGAAKIVGWHKEQIIDAFNGYMNTEQIDFPPLFGDGEAGKFMCEKMLESLG